MGKDNTIPARFVSNGELQAIKRGISREMFESFEVIWMTVMRDKFGFGQDRLAEIMEAELRTRRGVTVPEPDFIRKPISSGEAYWTARDIALTGGRTYKESDLRNLRVRTERDAWLSCETIWLYTLQLPRRRDTFGTDRLRRAQTEARALGAELAEHRISIADLREVLREEAHIVLQRPVPREAEVGKPTSAPKGRAPFTMPETAGGQCPPLRMTGTDTQP